ncbi:hypothetical protein ACLB2K_054571 [Fragaria x ananassa]
MTVCLAHQATAPVEQSGYGNEIEFTVYLIEILYGPNATSRRVAGIQGQFWSPSTFATISVSDLLVVAEPSLYSREVGRVQGLAVVASKDGSYNYQTSSFIFSEYNGSTLETQGTFDRVSGEPSEIAVVGGTKQFRGARGINILQLIVQASYYRISQVTFRFSIPI